MVCIVLAACFFLACFRATRDERRKTENAIAAIIPPIAGTWTRELVPGMMGVQEFSFDGKKGGGIFKEGDLDHDVKVEYDPSTKMFTGTVERVHYRDNSVPRFRGDIFLWLVGNDMFYFYAPKNAQGIPEQGFLFRKGTKPPWSVPNK